jgi:hypothetical protein
MNLSDKITLLLGTASRMDETDGNTTYFCNFKAGRFDSSQPFGQIWRIRQVGTEYFTEWADGDQLYNNVWDDRLILTYTHLN